MQIVSCSQRRTYERWRTDWQMHQVDRARLLIIIDTAAGRGGRRWAPAPWLADWAPATAYGRRRASTLPSPSIDRFCERPSRVDHARPITIPHRTTHTHTHTHTCQKLWRCAIERTDYCFPLFWRIGTRLPCGMAWWSNDYGAGHVIEISRVKFLTAAHSIQLALGLLDMHIPFYICYKAM